LDVVRVYPTVTMETPSNNPTAVVVNDDATQRFVLAGLLRHQGLNPLTFESAQAALCALDPQHPPGLIITDIYMPGIDGWRFCRLLRSAEFAAFNQVPILVVSATFSGDDATRITADLGANAFLPAPVDGRQFAETVALLLRGDSLSSALRVLIVEDSRSLSDLLVNTFQQHGFAADVATSCRQAQERIKTGAYELAVLDYHLPDGHGDALLAGFKAAKADCVCIMMTSDPHPDLAMQWMGQGASAYVKKPFAPRYLVELCTKARREQALLRVEDLLEERTRQLRDSQHHYQSLIENLTDIVWTFDLSGWQFTYASNSVESILGYPPGRTGGMTLDDLFDANVKNEVVTQFSRLLDPVCPAAKINLEAPHRRADGTCVWMEINGALLPGDPGGPVVISGVSRDISERKQAEELARRVEDEKRLILEATSEMVAYHDLDLKVKWANRAAAQTVGMPPEALIGRHCYQIWHQRTVPCQGCPTLQARDTNRPCQAVITTPDGRLFRLRGYPVRDGRGKVVALVEFGNDITKEIEIERRLQQTQRIEAVGLMAGGIAHDFNNILSPIMGYAEMLTADLAPDSASFRHAAGILKAARRAADLARQILAFSRQSEQRKGPIQIQQILKETIKLARATIPADIAVTWQIQSDCGTVRADPTQLHQIVMNLITNAYHAVEEKNGTIRVELRETFLGKDEFPSSLLESGQYACISISDTGSGIDPSIIGKIFDPYFTTKEQSKGTGLGLSIVHGIVKEYGGDIHVTSEVDKGTTFDVFLPIVTSEDEIEKVEDVTQYPKGTERILLVDDEQPIIRLERLMLESLGYQVTTRTSSIEALAAFQANPFGFDLVITDMAMPNMTGLQLSKKMTAVRPDIPILICTGFSEKIDRKQAAAFGVKGVLMKPIGKRELVEMVRQALDKETVYRVIPCNQKS